MINSIEEFEYGDVIYRQNGDFIDLYVYIGVADNGIDTHIVGFYLGSYETIRDLKHNFKINFNSSLDNEAEVVINYSKWLSLGHNVRGYLMKNQMLHKYKVKLGDAKMIRGKE